MNKINILILVILTTLQVYSQISNNNLNITVEKSYNFNTNDISYLIPLQTVTGIGGGLVMTLASIPISYIAFLISPNNYLYSYWFSVLLLYSIGSSLGVSIIGWINNYNGSYWTSLLGSIISLSVPASIITIAALTGSIGFYSSTGIGFALGIAFWVTFICCPAIGSIIGFDISINKSNKNAIINISENNICLNIPSIQYDQNNTKIPIFIYEY